MKTYELIAKVTEDGTLELPDFHLPIQPAPLSVKVIVVVSDADEDAEHLTRSEAYFSAASFRESWQQAIAGETIPLSQLWEDDSFV